MHTIPVKHLHGSYDVLLGPGLAAEAGARIAAVLPGRRLVVITDPTIRAALTAEGRWPALDATVHEVPPGEVAKDRDTWARLTDLLLTEG
ncbi:MAG TPA: hypothetical protein VFI13_07150, partial [Gemmatimonadales bacterium]|nr:hypothetical protein [Gemmatimonadales bacterium]